MAIHKVIEVLSQSKKSWEDAADRAVRDASKTIKNIRSVHVKELHALVEGKKIAQYRVTAKLTFEIGEG